MSIKDLIKENGNQYHDFADFLEKWDLLSKLEGKKTLSIVLLNEKLMEYKINMLEDDIQIAVLDAHIVTLHYGIFRFFCSFPHIQNEKLCYRGQKIPLCFLKTIFSENKTITFYITNEPILFEPPTPCCFYFKI